jgi:hypothetical protein
VLVPAAIASPSQHVHSEFSFRSGRQCLHSLDFLRVFTEFQITVDNFRHDSQAVTQVQCCKNFLRLSHVASDTLLTMSPSTLRPICALLKVRPDYWYLCLYSQSWYSVWLFLAAYSVASDNPGVWFFKLLVTGVQNDSRRYFNTEC